jgi:hypothetical protein
MRQALLQAPQLARSVAVWTQTPSQSVRSAPQPHLPAAQI